MTLKLIYYYYTSKKNIHIFYRCNGKIDCPGNTDEDGCDMHCENRDSSLFSCKQEYYCIKKSLVCNGKNDCNDGSDETLEACAKGKNII